MEGNTNLFLSGNYAPIRSEDDFELKVRGEIPPELRGSLFRIGANPQFEPRDPAGHHWFAGDGMIHKFAIEDGRVTYRNRYVRTPKWQLEHQAGRALFGGFNPRSADPSVLGKDGGSANTNIIWHAGKLMALEEAHKPTEMEPVSLETKGYIDAYRSRVTAHPKLDPKTGELIWFAYNAGDPPMSARMSYGITGPDGTVLRRDDFEAPFAAMMHDFMVTENYVVFPVMPLTGSVERVMKGLPLFTWEPEKGTFVGVMLRNADVSTIRWFNTDACYVFHPLNSWEADGKIFCDVMRYDRAPLFANVDGSPGAPATAKLVRWTIDPSKPSDAIRQEPLDDLDAEFPRVDARIETRKHRHGWFNADTTRSGPFRLNSIAHLDLQTGRRQIFALGPMDGLSEPVFAPRPAGTEEGDGWITAVAYRAAENRSDLLIFNALDVGKGPIAVAEVPRRVPYGFHGNWVEG